MQREETAVAIGPHRIRLLQRPPQVPPSAPPAAHDGPAGAGPLAHQAPHLSDPPNGASQERYPRSPPNDSIGPLGGSLTPEQPPSASAALQLSDCVLGWELWPAAWRLAAFLASAPGAEVLRAAAAVVELGAGLGLPGILAAKAGARHVTLTDLPQALPLLAANVELNGVAAVCRTAVLDWVHLAAAAARDAAAAAAAARSSSSGGGSSNCTAAVGEQRRQEQHELGAGGRGLEEGAGPPHGGAEQHAGAYDVVLAADVVYVSSLAPLLADTIAAVCRRDDGDGGGGGGSSGGGGGGGGAVVLVGHTVRKSVWLDRATGLVRTDETDEPWEAFMERMTRLHGFSCSRVAEVEAASGGGAGAAMPPDTFVCAFTRPSSRFAPS